MQPLYGGSLEKPAWNILKKLSIWGYFTRYSTVASTVECNSTLDPWGLISILDCFVEYVGHAVAQLVEALQFQPEGRGFYSRWYHWEFFIDIMPYYGPEVDSASNRNDYQEYFLGVKAAGAQGWQSYYLHVPIVLKSGSLNFLEPSGPVQACNGIALPYSMSVNLHNSYVALLDKAGALRKRKVVHVHVTKACGGVAYHSWPRQ